MNLRGQVDHVTVAIPGGNAVDRTYTYNSTGGAPGPNDPGPNLDEVADTVDPTQSRFYFYDELDRLQKATDLSGNALFQYGYDAVGNRTSQVSAAGTTSYSYESGTDRLDASAGAAALDYAHDAYGNRIYQGSAPYSGTPSLLYDDANRLVQVEDPNNGSAVLATYTYDAFGRRVKKVTPTQTFLYVYDTAGHLLQEVQKQIGGALHDHARTYVYVEDEMVGLVDQDYYQVGAHAWPAIRLPDAKSPIWPAGLVLVGGAGLLLLARRRGVGTAPAAASTALLLVFVCAGAGRQTAVYSWVHTDPLGTPIAVTNTNDYGAVVVIWRARYEPFGKATVDQDPDGDGQTFTLNVRFPGQYEDAETGLHSNWHRYYDPSVGRYLSADPVGQRTRTNIFEYSRNSPLNFVDPLGLYGTKSCSYYDQTCQANGGTYECRIAPELCPRFPNDESRADRPDPLGNWSECVRQCLQEKHKARMQDPGTCSESNQIGPLLPNGADHAACFAGCAQNPENPYDPKGPPLPDAIPSLYE